MLHLIWSVIMGFIVGLIARAVMPGADAMGFLATTAVGIVGSAISGFIGSADVSGLACGSRGRLTRPAGRPLMCAVASLLEAGRGADV